MDDSVSLRIDQIADLSVYIRDKMVMNLSDPGAGKTPPTVVFMKVLWDDHKVGTAWIMPKSLMEKNRREILRFTDFKPHEVVILDGTPSQIKTQLKSGAKVFLMGFRRWALSYREMPSYIRAIMVDEFHMGFKSVTSQQTQALFWYFDTQRAEWFIPMTGSIINGKLSSVYPAIHVIEPRYYPNFDSFMYQHAIKDWDGNIIGWQNHDKIAEIFRRHGIRHTFESIHGAQDPVFIPEVVPMNPRQREMYDEFHEKAILELEHFFLTGTEPGVAYLRARQLMEHPNQFPDLNNPGKFIDIMPGHSPAKEDQLEIHLDHHASTDTPFIVFSSMQPQQRRATEMFERYKIKCGLINGDTPTKMRNEIDQAFCAGEIKGIVCSPPCAGVGYNWQFCGKQELDHMMFMTLGYLDTEFTQAYKRGIRGKREKGLRVTIPEYADSIDQNVMGILYRKSVEANRVDPTYKILQLSGFEKDYSMT